MDYTDSEQERFERLFRGHHVAVHAFARRRMDAEGVDDVVSETFLVAWRRLDSVPDEALPWLLGVARNVIATKRRGDARRMRLQARAEAEYQDHPEGQHESFGMGVVTGALARLNERDQETLTLVAWDGLTPAQAAAVLDIPVNRFRVRLHRAGRRLRWALDAEIEDADAAEQQRHPTTSPNSQGAIA
jgi:RNA polymerase sigma factor (sigma-70 family)